MFSPHIGRFVDFLKHFRRVEYVSDEESTAKADNLDVSNSNTIRGSAMNLYDEVCDFLTDAAMIFAAESRCRETSGNASTDRERQVFSLLSEAANDLRLERGEIFSELGRLDPFQRSQLSKILDGYQKVLDRVSRLDEEDRYDFFVGLPYDIAADMRILQRDYERHKKKPASFEKEKEVAEPATSCASEPFLL